MQHHRHSWYAFGTNRASAVEDKRPSTCRLEKEPAGPYDGGYQVHGLVSKVIENIDCKTVALKCGALKHVEEIA